MGVLIPDNLWYSVAQDRQLWRSCEHSFIQSRLLRPHGQLDALNEGDVEVDLQSFLQALEDVQCREL